MIVEVTMLDGVILPVEVSSTISYREYLYFNQAGIFVCPIDQGPPRVGYKLPSLKACIRNLLKKYCRFAHM